MLIQLKRLGKYNYRFKIKPDSQTAMLAIIMRTLITIICILNLTICFSQDREIDFCIDNLRKDTLVGKKVKIFQGRIMKYPIDYSLYEIKDSSLLNKLRIQGSHIDKQSLLEDGAIGEVIYVSDIPVRLFKDGSGSVQKKFYVIKIGDDFFAVDCDWLIEVKEPDVIEINKKWNDLYIDYPDECSFSYENISWIDKYSSYFACELKNQNIDTILYAKLISHGYSRVNHISIVLWYERGQGFVKIFQNNGLRKPIEESEKYLFDWRILLNCYTENKNDFKGIVKSGQFYKAYYEVMLVLPNDNYKGQAWIDIMTLNSYIHFTKAESSENDFYFYLENIFKVIE